VRIDSNQYDCDVFRRDVDVCEQDLERNARLAQTAHARMLAARIVESEHARRKKCRARTSRDGLRDYLLIEPILDSAYEDEFEVIREDVHLERAETTGRGNANRSLACDSAHRRRHGHRARRVLDILGVGRIAGVTDCREVTRNHARLNVRADALHGAPCTEVFHPCIPSRAEGSSIVEPSRTTT